MKNLHTIDIKSWDEEVGQSQKSAAIKALEEGKVLYFPALAFPLQPHHLPLLSPDKTDPKSKNISYDPKKDAIGGQNASLEEALSLKEMLKSYAKASRTLLEMLLPSYIPHLTQARTSLRPVEIEGRKSSPRKDDTRLHVDSFPSSPTWGKRIMRIFTNVNQEGKPRVWRVGEPFVDVVNKIGPRTKKPLPGSSKLLQLLRITKDYRTLYDHYMMQIHDNMKYDLDYQKQVPQEEIRFPPNSTWIVYTDQVSHAAMSGQHMFEQTFHLPYTAMQNQASTPLAVLERYYKKKLIP